MYAATRLLPQLRTPRVANFILPTANLASSTELTIGTTKPSAPASSVRWIQTVSFHGTRAIGTAPPS
jgi:hypothetical protein